MSASYEDDMRYERDEPKDQDNKPKRGLIVGTLGLAALVAAGAGAWFYFQRQPAPVPVAAAPTPVAEAPVAAPPVAVAASEPQVKFPIEQAQTSSVEKTAPDLLRSDPVARDALTKLLGAQRVMQFFITDDFVRRFVATVDNLPREKAAANMRPVKPLTSTSAGAFKVNGSGDSMSISPENSARYTPWVQLLESVNTGALVATYVRLYPLFQEAYKEQGYPKGYFNDRLIEAIDNALGAPNISTPIALTQPRVMYQFADAKLESLSAGQKIMLRMGSANEARVKAKLNEVRAALVGKGLR
jgi:Protein of unknown function (DUF3014)